MNSKVTKLISRQASEWFVLMRSETVTERERSAFLHWYNECAEHKEAFRSYELIWRELGDLAVSTEGKRLRDSVNPIHGGLFSKYVRGWLSGISSFFGRSSFWGQQSGGSNEGGLFAIRGIPAARFALAGLVLFVSVFLANNLLKGSVDLASYQTDIAQVQKIQLPDGTLITLSGKSRITAWDTGSERHVELLKGQAFFEVAKNPDKPFYVKAGDTLVRVIGTQFDVNRTTSLVRVAVLEGIVSVSDIPDNNKTINGQESLMITAGLQVSRNSDGGFSPVEKVATMNFANWRSGRLVYSNARLQDVIDDVNRYSRNQILLDETLHNIKVTIAFEVEQINSLPMLLTKMLPVVYARESSGAVLILPSTK
jgi:transmembrane sensor